MQAILKQAHQVGIFKSDPTVTEHISQLEQLAIFIKDSLKNSSESEVIFLNFYNLSLNKYINLFNNY